MGDVAMEETLHTRAYKPRFPEPKSFLYQPCWWWVAGHIEDCEKQ